MVGMTGMLAVIIGGSVAIGDPPHSEWPFRIVDAQGGLSTFVRSDVFDGEFCQLGDFQGLLPAEFLNEEFSSECGELPVHALSENFLVAGPDRNAFHLQQDSIATTHSKAQPDIADASAETVAEINLELDEAGEVEITWMLESSGFAMSFIELFDADFNSMFEDHVSSSGDTVQEQGSATIWMEAGAWTLSIFTSSHAGSPNEWTSPASTASVVFGMQVLLVGDLNGDSMVDGADLAIMLGFWGECPSKCVADLDASGVVDGLDLALLLGNWDV